MIDRGGSNPLQLNALTRYTRPFSSTTLFELIKADPSFEVQGQWLAAASYGLMQIIPEDFNKRLAQRDILSPADLAAVKARYDPMEDSPIDGLFDPRNCVPLGGFFDVKVSLPAADAESSDPAWTGQGNQTTWDRLWKKRLCMFNIGSASSSCAYANKIVDNEAGWFMPQP